MVTAKEQEISFLCDNQSICAAPVLYTMQCLNLSASHPAWGYTPPLHLNRTESCFTSS